jgi:transposase-like protein
MDWPTTRVEDIPAEDFQPPFCPNPSCSAHTVGSLCFARAGHDKRNDGRSYRRWRCRLCGRTCTQRTFSLTYWLKRPELLQDIAKGIVAGSANRQTARTLGCAHTTVALQQARIGRHAMLLLQLLLRNIETIDEPIVYDHFESFAFSQDHAFGMGTPVGQQSWFMYGLDDAAHRIGRRGRRSRAVGREHRRPGAYVRAHEATLDRLLDKIPKHGTLTLLTDGHPAYKSAVRRHPGRDRIDHRIFPNPPRWMRHGHVARIRNQEMFAVDLAHKLLRHTLSHHRRETIAFNRRLNAALERGFIFAVWRNLVKGRSERKPDRRTPAMLLNLTDGAWSWATLLAQRLFPARVPLPCRWEQIYRREIVTEAVGNNTRHCLKYAY